MPERRSADLASIASAAVAAVIVICLWYDRPVASVAACAAILGLLLRRFNDPRDRVGLLVGAVVGNGIELACDAAGVWVHADRSVAGLAPPYILICYPILGLVLPRLIDAFAAGRTPRGHSAETWPHAALTLAVFVTLSMRFGRDPLPQSIVCAAFVFVTFRLFHTRRDLAAAVGGAMLAMAWEIPATLAGAWRFPSPQLLGLIPFWLPAAYAVFFVTMDRIIAAWCEARQRAMATPSGA